MWFSSDPMYLQLDIGSQVRAQSRDTGPLFSLQWQILGSLITHSIYPTWLHVTPPSSPSQVGLNCKKLSYNCGKLLFILICFLIKEMKKNTDYKSGGEGDARSTPSAGRCSAPWGVEVYHTPSKWRCPPSLKLSDCWSRKLQEFYEGSVTGGMPDYWFSF